MFSEKTRRPGRGLPSPSEDMPSFFLLDGVSSARCAATTGAVRSNDRMCVS